MSTRQKLNFMARAWRYRYRLDPYEIRYLVNSIGLDDVVVDVGAHKGGYTYWMRKAVGEGGKVFCFEPQSELAVYLSRTMEYMGWKNVTIENLGVSSRNTTLTLTAPGTKASPGASFEDLGLQGLTTKVEVVRIDDYFANRERQIGFFKVDAEGHELEVFRGAEKVLSEDKPILMFECEARHRQDGVGCVFEYLEGLGYEGHFYLKGKAVSSGDFETQAHQRIGKKPYINNFIFEHRT